MHRMSKVALAAAFTFSLSALAEEPSREGRVSISPYYAYIDELEDHTIGSNDGLGLGIGLGLTERLGLELSMSKLDDVDTVWLSALYGLTDQGTFRPYLVGGLGRADFDDLVGQPQEDQFFAGVGSFVDLGTNFSLRGDVRAVKTASAGGIEPYAQIGLTFFLGGRFPGGNSAPAVADSDGDGVSDTFDRCPRTAAGRNVGTNGCEPDSDGDGVVDHDDRCPSTSQGTPVDDEGCALDTDSDGVTDGTDQCPATERGAVVDETGCYVEIEEVVTIDMTLEFATDSAAILPAHVAEIGPVVEFLRKYPTSQAVIEGHTDSRGSDEYNLQLSQRRAAAVRDYLVTEAKVGSERLRSVGYGESRPKASNETAAGREENRRVTARISGKTSTRR